MAEVSGLLTALTLAARTAAPSEYLAPRAGTTDEGVAPPRIERWVILAVN